MSFKENAAEIMARAMKALVHKERSMVGPAYIYDDEILNGERSRYSAEIRNYQGIPSIECTKKVVFLRFFIRVRMMKVPETSCFCRKAMTERISASRSWR